MADADSNPNIRYSYRFAHCELSEATGELRVRGSLVPLPPRDRAVLFLLVRRAGEFISNEEAATAVWGDYPVTGKTVGNAVWNVRQAIGDDDHSIIKNERNRGYILAAPVERTEAVATPKLQLVAGMPVPGRADYRLLEKIGGGGYGDVWLCQGPDDRSVFKFCRESAHLAAIKREVTISRLLQASLLGDEHQRYFVPIVEWDFEVWPSYVESPFAGHNLKAWAAKRGGLKAVALDERIEIIATIADAVAAAHSVGALHKDLKPENVLIEESGASRLVRLTDFGAGHLLDREQLEKLSITVRGWTVSHVADSTSGTLLWMAPELFEGATPTLQSDVYSLGVMLYQMVVGDLGRVLAPDWQPDIEDELLREDIDLATRRNPAQRLGDAKEFARRLRTLTDRRTEKVRLRVERARAERAEEQLKRGRARRPFIWGTVAALIGGLAASSYFYYEQLQKTRAAQALSDFVSEDFLQQALPENGGTATISLKDAMAKSVPLARKRFANEPELELKILTVFGNTMSNLGAYKETADIMRRLAQLDATVHGPDSADVLVDRLIMAYDLLEEGSADDAEKELSLLRPAVKAKGKTSKVYPVWLQVESAFAFERSDMEGALDLSRETVDYLQAQKGTAAFDQAQIDVANLTLLEALVFAGHSLDAVQTGEKVLEDLTSRHGADASYALSARQYIASGLRDIRQFDRANHQFTAVCPWIEHQNGATNKDALACRQDQAQLFEDEQQWDEARTSFDRVRAGYLMQSEPCEHVAPCIYATADLAFVFAKLGEQNRGLDMARKAAHYAESGKPVDPTILPYTLYILGSTASANGRIEEAQQSLDHYQALIQQSFGEAPEWKGRGLLLRAKILAANQDFHGARTALTEALTELQKRPTLTIREQNDAFVMQEQLEHFLKH